MVNYIKTYGTVTNVYLCCGEQEWIFSRNSNYNLRLLYSLVVTPAQHLFASHRVIVPFSRGLYSSSQNPGSPPTTACVVFAETVAMESKLNWKKQTVNGNLRPSSPPPQDRRLATALTINISALHPIIHSCCKAQTHKVPLRYEKEKRR